MARCASTVHDSSQMKLGFIGVGKMGAALLEGVLNAELCSPRDISIHDAHRPAVDACVESTGVEAAGSNQAVVASADATFLCVKPNDLAATVREIPDSLEESLLVSIAAGVSTKDLESWVENRHRVIRVMPNTPALVGKGASAYALGSRPTENRKLPDIPQSIQWFSRLFG